MRSEGDYRRKVLLVRLCAIGEKDTAREVKGIVEGVVSERCVY